MANSTRSAGNLELAAGDLLEALHQRTLQVIAFEGDLDPTQHRTRPPSPTSSVVMRAYSRDRLPRGGSSTR